MQHVDPAHPSSQFEVRGPLTWLKVATLRAQSTFVVSIAGDADYGNLRDRSVEPLLGDYRASGCQSIAIDLAGVTKADSTGLAWLLRLWDAAESHGSAVTLRNVPRHLQRSLQLNGIAGLFAYEDC